MKNLIIVLGVALISNLGFACQPLGSPTYDQATYYAGTEGVTGDELKFTLNQIIRGHLYYSYSPCTWFMLESADEDPNDTNSVIGIYTRRSILKVNRDQGGNTPDYWNREHVWPKNRGFPSRGQHAYTDGHQLHASDKSVNADRDSRDFADGGTPNGECSECLMGNGTWEAPDEVKGDIARSMFYMATRYEGNDASGVPDLELVDRLTTTGEPNLGKLCDLVNWHLQDPVSAAERTRHEVIFQWQGNRNPFVDRPDDVIAIWGDQCGIVAPPIPIELDEDVPLPLWALLLLGASLGGILARNAR